MENETPQKDQTGGLKLMTVFIIVLAVHVVGIGGWAIYRVMKGSTSDATVAQSSKTEPTATKSGDESTNLQGNPSIQTEDPSLTKNGVAAVTPEGTKPEEVEGEAPTASAAKPGTPVVGDTGTVPSETVTTTTVTDTAVTPTVKPAITPKAVASVAPTVTPQAAPSRMTYSVKSGDTLRKIAKRNLMTVTELKKINGLKSNNLKIGQTLVIKAGAVASNVASASPSAPVAPMTASVKTTPVMATAGSTTYKVSSGDTLTKIARRFNTSAAAIMAANKIADANKLKIGASLMIPQKAEKRSVTETTAPAVPTQTASAAPDLVMNR